LGEIQELRQGSVRKHRFNAEDVRIESEEVVYAGFFQVIRYTLRHRLFGGGWSKLLRRELFRRGDAVGVLVYDPLTDRIGLVEQFRVGALQDNHGPWQYELVAGMVSANETPREVALRELHEEAGLQIDDLLPICDYRVSAGGTDEKMHLYCALTDLSGRGGVFGLESEAEDILFQVWTFEEAQGALKHGLLNSAAATISLLWLENYRAKRVLDPAVSE